MTAEEHCQLRGYQLNAAVAKSLGWICWSIRGGERYIILDPTSRRWVAAAKNVFENMEEVTGELPANAELSLPPTRDWAHSLDAAARLGEPGWQWMTAETSTHLYMRAWYSWDKHLTSPTGDITVALADFPSKTEAHATARCLVFLQMIESVKVTKDEL